MPLTSSAYEIVRIPLNADGVTESRYSFTKPISKVLIRCATSGFDSAVEGDIRYAFESGQCANGGRFFGLKAGEAKGVDLGGGTPAPIWFRANTPVADLVVMLEIWS